MKMSVHTPHRGVALTALLVLGAFASPATTPAQTVFAPRPTVWKASVLGPSPELGDPNNPNDLSGLDRPLPDTKLLRALSDQLSDIWPAACRDAVSVVKKVTTTEFPHGLDTPDRLEQTASEPIRRVLDSGHDALLAEASEDLAAARAGYARHLATNSYWNTGDVGYAQYKANLTQKRWKADWLTHVTQADVWLLLGRKEGDDFFFGKAAQHYGAALMTDNHVGPLPKEITDHAARRFAKRPTPVTGRPLDAASAVAARCLLRASARQEERMSLGQGICLLAAACSSPVGPTVHLMSGCTGYFTGPIQMWSRKDAQACLAAVNEPDRTALQEWVWDVGPAWLIVEHAATASPVSSDLARPLAPRVDQDHINKEVTP